MHKFSPFRLVFLALTAFVLAVFSACSDDDSDVEYAFGREISDISIIRQCADDADSGAVCYMVRFRFPYDTLDLKQIYLWVGDSVVTDSTSSVDDEDLEKATAVFKFSSELEAQFDTIDLTPYIQEHVEANRDSLLISLYCDYASGHEGSVRRTYLRLRDDIAPSELNMDDSTWTTGALITWTRPTDQTDFYKPGELSGPIVGYNIIVYTKESSEDLRKLKIRVETPEGIDSTGETLYERNARIYAIEDSLWVGSESHIAKNELRFVILDGKGYNEDPDSNFFRLTIEGLKPESEYRIGYSSWDSSGNDSGTERYDREKGWQTFNTTDSIAPLMPTKIFTLEDTLFPGTARLDSNNRLRFFWSQSVDPYQVDHGIKVDSVLSIPDTCLSRVCYGKVSRYKIEYLDRNTKEWVVYRQPDSLDRYTKLYKISKDTMKVASKGTFVTDTIRWVAPGDTLILRIRSIDESGYYSVALVDTIAVSPGALAKEIECPEGFVPVKASDSNVFCMERLEHQDDSGAFVTNVRHSEAEAICEGISADGFKVGLCNERDWELVCLSGGTLTYGVIQEDVSDSPDYLSDFLIKDCNVATNDSLTASDVVKRNSRCMNPMGVRDMPGQFQEWVNGRSEDTIAVVKGGSYKTMGGIDRETQARCTNRSFPIFTRLAYTTDSVYLYREGTKVDTVFKADTSKTLFMVLTKKDFKDSLQFFDVQDSNGNSVGTDYALYSEYKKGGEKWLEELANGMKYVPDHVEVVFLTGERVSYRGAANFYRSPIIGFRCCAYKNE